MNPLYKDKIFLSISIPAIVILAWSIISITASIWNEYDFVSMGSANDWRMAVEIYKVPLSIAAGLFAIFALFTSIHRLTLQSEQLDDAKKLNEFNIYFKQREEFDKKFSEPISKWIQRLQWNRDLRMNEFFEDFDPKEHIEKKSDTDIVMSKIICLRLYEFCFGVGRQIHLSEKFKSFVSEAHKDLREIKDSNEYGILAKKAALNERMRTEFIEGGITHWHGTYESEWFSDNEKFHFTLALLRLLGEVEAFAGSPRDFSLLSELCSQGQSIEHSFFFGPNMILGERKMSPGGKAGRQPLLLSRFPKFKDERKKANDESA